MQKLRYCLTVCPIFILRDPDFLAPRHPHFPVTNDVLQKQTCLLPAHSTHSCFHYTHNWFHSHQRRLQYDEGPPVEHDINMVAPQDACPAQHRSLAIPSSTIKRANHCTASAFSSAHTSSSHQYYHTPILSYTHRSPTRHLI